MEVSDEEVDQQQAWSLSTRVSRTQSAQKNQRSMSVRKQGTFDCAGRMSVETKIIYQTFFWESQLQSLLTTLTVSLLVKGQNVDLL